MAAEERKAKGAESGTLVLLQAMSETTEDELAARLLGLSRLAEATLFAATWPTAPDAVRTLTNSDGEQAMPLFSGLDTLELASRRFGWANPDGSLCFRELAAHEALKSALAQGVHFVVFDILAPHATEFSRDEVERVMRDRAERPMISKAGAAARAAAKQALKERPRTRSGPLREVGKAPRELSEMDLPFTNERTTGKIEAPEAVRSGSDRTAKPNQAGVNARAVARRADARPLLRPAIERNPAESDASARRARGLALQAIPEAAEAQPAPAVLPLPPPPPAIGRLEAVPAANTPVAAEPSSAVHPPTLPAFDDLPSLPPLEDMPAPEAEALDAAVAPEPVGELAGAAAAFDMLADSLAPQAKPAALEAAVLVAEAAKLTKDPSTQKAAAEVGAMLKDMARKGGVPEEEAPNPVQSAAKALAGLLGSELAADAARRTRRGKRSAPNQPKMEPAEAPATEAAAPNGGLSAPAASLGDEALTAIAEALRKYPEVEWACELSDGSELTAVGVRVDPGFVARVAEIEAAVLAAGQAKGAAFSVLMLRDAQQMKDARSQGSAFFPWRKRAAPKR